MNDHLKKINQLLLKLWDPIGVGNTAEASDEYDRYSPEIYKIIQSTDSYQELFKFLWSIETECMGLRGNRHKTEECAKLLFNLMKNKD
jgi:hypothetical protein